jgi:SulP family sulfate permease
LEWVENRILQTAGEQDEQSLSLKELFHQLLPSETHLNDLFNFLEKKDVQKGDYLIWQGDPPDNIYFVESGRVTAQLEYTDRPTVRLETMQAGRVIGEIGYYLKQKRTAAVVADEPGVVYILSAESLAKMEKDSPGVASYFHQLIIKLLAERTTHLIRTVAALEK